jgi:arylformamidase
MIDLTFGITSKLKVFPGSPQPSFIKWSKFDIHGYDSEAMFLSTHTGTHVDAPSHFISNAANIDQIAVDRFFCKNALLVKILKKANQQINYKDIVNQGINENDTAVVISTGWEKQAEKDNYVLDNPGISADAAKYLVEKKVNAVAIDTPSIDAGIDNDFTAHKILLSNNILIIENLCNLEKINRNRFTLVAIPLKLIGSTGSPVRAIGIEV